MLLCLGIACYLHRRSKLLLALLAANALMLFSTYSRGSLLGVLVVLPYLYFGRKRWMLATLIAGLIAGSIGMAIYHTDPRVDYMATPSRSRIRMPKSPIWISAMNGYGRGR